MPLFKYSFALDSNFLGWIQSLLPCPLTNLRQRQSSGSESSPFLGFVQRGLINLQFF